MTCVIKSSDVIPSSTDATHGTAGRISTLGSTFFSSEERTQLLPYNIRRYTSKGKGGVVSQHFEANGRAFVDFDDAVKYASSNFLTCPLSGIQVPYGKENTSVLCRYLKAEYPAVFNELKTLSGGHINSIFIYPDCYSVTRRFINHKFPNRSFASKSELDASLKLGHPISLYSEIECKYGDECHGFEGGCGFNHPSARNCPDDISDAIRCRKTYCADNHGRGRVKWLIQHPQKTPVSTPQKVSTPDAPKKVINEDSDNDSEDDVLQAMVNKRLAGDAKPAKKIQLSLPTPKKLNFAECEDGFQLTKGAAKKKKQMDMLADLQKKIDFETKKAFKASKPSKPFVKVPTVTMTQQSFPELPGFIQQAVETKTWQERVEEVREQERLRKEKLEEERLAKEEEERLAKEEEERLAKENPPEPLKKTSKKSSKKSKRGRPLTAEELEQLGFF